MATGDRNGKGAAWLAVAPGRRRLKNSTVTWIRWHQNDQFSSKSCVFASVGIKMSRFFFKMSR
jgi:hypothetical protein